MATKTLITASATTLTAVVVSPAGTIADVATINNSIKDDLNVAHPRWPGAFIRGGFLYVPNRGILKVLPGDVVAVDNTGWPILVSAHAIADATDWTLS